MEVKMQTSFIPKKPIVESQTSDSGVSLFLILAVIVFIVAVAASAGVWLWQGSLVSQIAKDKQALVDARDSYEEGTINPLIRLDDRIEQSKSLLNNHLAITPVFALLEKNVLTSIRLKTMKFSYAANKKIMIELSGLATNYDALSKQSDSFGSETLRPFISQPIVSDFNPTNDGSIAFNFNALIDPKLVSYVNTLVGGGDVLDNTTASSTSI